MSQTTKGIPLHPPQHTKSFVKTVEEAAKESDHLLHEMWTNLLASQFFNDFAHPHFVELLSHFSRLEAELLLSLLPLEQLGGHGGGYFTSDFHQFTRWRRKAGDEPESWNLSVTLLLDFSFAGITSPKVVEDSTPLLYRTATGPLFLSTCTQEPCDLE